MRANRLVVLLMALVALIGTVGSPSPAHAADAPAAIKGQVLSFMDPLGFARVTVFNADTGAAVRSVLTDGDGYYLSTGLPAGRIQVRATKTGYLDAWASGVSTRAAATVYTLVAGQTLEQTWDERMVLYLDLAPEGVVTGTVVGVNQNPYAGPASGPISGAKVTVVAAATGKSLGSAVTDAYGHFRVGRLPAGQVKVKASAAGWLAGWSPNNPPGAAYDFAVYAGQSTDIGLFRLYAPATVYGYVIYNMDPIAGTAQLTVFNADTHKAIRRLTVGTSFQLDGLAQGRYQLRVVKDGFLDSWSAVISLTPGQVLGPDWNQGAVVFELVPEAVVAGEVMGFSSNPTSPWDDPLAGVKVTVVDATTGAGLGWALTDAGGRFAIGKLAAGQVKVKAAKTGWLTSWAPGVRTRAVGTSFATTAGEVTEIGTVALYAPAAIEGQVLSSMDPVGDVKVTVIDADTHAVLGSVMSDGSGNYRVGGLWPGRVKVSASKPGYITNWADSFAQRTRSTATVFTLAPGQVLQQTWSGSPALYLDIVREVVVKGQVLGDFDPIAGASVTVFDAATGVALRSATSDADGYFRINQINPWGVSNIQVRASKAGWRTSWANGKWTRATADRFPIAPGAVIEQSWDPITLYLDLARLT
ncbi:MAG TPA: carboxypeptidase-like regulatory domain-containing protein [Propionicimonas sp.]|nr:carboxypeptidase-like regulatory domain-containing protein [Propionicimonas sp.]